MFILKKGHQPGVYVPLRALFLVYSVCLSLVCIIEFEYYHIWQEVNEKNTVSIKYVAAFKK